MNENEVLWRLVAKMIGVTLSLVIALTIHFWLQRRRRRRRDGPISAQWLHAHDDDADGDRPP